MASISFLILAVVPYVSLLAASGGALRVMHNVREVNDNSVCTIEQTKCSSDCSSITTCYQVNNHFYESTEECSAGTACNPYKKECTSVKAACPVFQCGGEGVFPDLLDCTKYHVCDAKGNDHPGTCQENFYYNTTAQDCVKYKETEAVECKFTPVPQCTSDKPTGVLEHDPQIYYICGNGQAKLYYCARGLQFNPDTYECADSKLACIDGKGNYPDTNNCKMYYECQGEQQFATHKSCEAKKYYDSKQRQCVDGEVCKKS